LLTGGPATARAELLVVAGITLVLALLAAGARIAPPTRVPGPEPGLFGKWTVAPANVVVETCEVCADGTASGSEPQRWAERKAEASGTSLVITFKDGRVERWSLPNGRVVVEHRCPATGYPTGAAVVGVADRVP
jgi:hypothetical protein